MRDNNKPYSYLPNVYGWCFCFIVVVAFSLVIYGYITTYERPSPKKFSSEVSALIKKVLPNSEVLSVEPLKDAAGKLMLFEVELKASAGDPKTQGFIYVTPDARYFLNGPLMDRRSRLGSLSDDLAEKAQTVTSEPLDTPEKDLYPERLDFKESSRELKNGSASDPQEALERERLALLQSLEGLPSVVTPSVFEDPKSVKDVYVLLDPVCAHCRSLYADKDRLSETYAIRFHWIPVFSNETGWALASWALSSSDQSSGADKITPVERLDLVMGDNLQSLIDPIKTLSEDDFQRPKKATELLMRLRSGTPLVVFQKPHGEIEVISGIPDAADWETLFK